MNHLKYIRGISVRASPNGALPLHYGQHADVYFENRELKSQLLRSNPLSVAKRNHGIDVRYSQQFRQDSLRLVSKESKTICKQRSKSKSSVTSLKKKSSLHKKLPSENIAKGVCHYSTCRNVKFNSNGINKQLMPQSNVTNDARNINRYSSFIASVEKHPRSYAEMIADYSESLYKESTVAARSDIFRFNNVMRRSPFSTFSIPSSDKTTVNVTECSKFSTEREENDFSLSAKSLNLRNQYNIINTVECCDFQHHNMCAAEAMKSSKNIGESCVTTDDLKSDDQSYAKLVADCSKSANNIPITNVLNDGLVPKKNVLTRNSFESVTIPRKDNSTYTQNKLREITPALSTMPFEKNIKRQVTGLKASDWLKEMENVMNDLKSMSEKKVAKVVPKVKEGDVLRPTDASDNSSDRIHGFTELKSNKQREKDITIRKLSYQSNKIDRIEKRKKDFELRKHNYSSDKTSNLPQYFSNAVEGSTSIRKNSTHVTTSDNSGVLKQPQVKLRMVPSEKESIVSINVDQASIGSSDPRDISTSKHLSVVVQSDQKEDLQSTDNQWNAPTLRRTKSALQRSDFGPMHISISEDSAPVKQIEFSINGKPVSELKSITARTERLDVVSSVDKIEIRIPFAKDDLNALDKKGDLSKGTNSNILNVQISANFQDEFRKDSSAETAAKAMRYQYDTDTTPKPSSSISKTPYLSNNFPEANEATVNRSNIQQYESFKRMDIKFNDERNINKYKIPDDADLKIRPEATKNVNSTDKTTDVLSSKEVNKVGIRGLNMRKANTTRHPEANKYDKNESSDNRIPSKVIPWWSSSDSFNKIKKKEDHKPLMPPSSRNDYKAASNFNQNFITKTLLSKPKETLNLKTLTKKTQSTNNATVVTNASSNTISYSNSIKPFEESKPTFHYALLGLKLNQENADISPEIIKNSLKAEDNQALNNQDINKISGVKQTKLITLFKSDTMNIKGKDDISVKEKTSVLQIKVPNSAQNLSLKKDQEEKNNYLLKQTKLIDDASKNLKSKIKDILDSTKSIEEKKDDSLTSSKLANSFKESSDTTMIDKSPLQISKQMEPKSSKSPNKIADIKKLSSSQIISNSISKTKNCVISKNLIDENINKTSTLESLKTKKIDTEDMIARIVTQNPKNKNSLSKECEKTFKSESSKRNLSAGPSKKSNDLVGFKSAGSKSRITSSNICIYDKKLLMKPFYSNFNRKNDIMLNSQSATFKVRQNLNDVDTLEHPVPIGCDGSWINTDRPEKSILYSAWLQRSENDIEKNGKLF